MAANVQEFLLDSLAHLFLVDCKSQHMQFVIMNMTEV